MDCCDLYVPTIIREYEDCDLPRTYKCMVWQDDDIIQSDGVLSDDFIVMVFRYSCTLVVPHPHGSDESRSEKEEIEQYVWIHKKSLLLGDGWDEYNATFHGLAQIIKSFDSDFMNHEVNGMVEDVINFVWKLEEANLMYGRQKGMSVVYEIRLYRYLNGFITDISELLQEITREDDDGVTTATVGASKVMIESLPKGKLGAAAAACCAVCLADMLNGDEIIWMPCTHFYHQQCITKWLQTRNICPLCRFSLPSIPH